MKKLLFLLFAGLFIFACTETSSTLDEIENIELNNGQGEGGDYPDPGNGG